MNNDICIFLVRICENEMEAEYEFLFTVEYSEKEDGK
ncbi:MAG: hypothetical protein ACI9CZ_000940, partial [Flavobacterium sp.]